MKNIPNKIYLNLGDDFTAKEFKEADFNDASEVSWCKDRIDKNDLVYYRKPFIDKAIAEIKQEMKKCEITNPDEQQLSVSGHFYLDGLNFALTQLEGETK